jgi:hypothetical protein
MEDAKAFGEFDNLERWKLQKRLGSLTVGGSQPVQVPFPEQTAKVLQLSNGYS